jgi:hypothetical protein
MQARGFDIGPFVIDIPEPYAAQIQHQQLIISETINEVLKQAQKTGVPVS